MYRKLERIEVANLDFIRFFSSCTPCRPQRHPNANTFLAMHIVQRLLRQSFLWRTAQKSTFRFPFFSGPAAITRHKLALFLWSAVGCQP